jgi:5-bromo-4-chloroindolyl phosphate hydrolysis protein
VPISEPEPEPVSYGQTIDAILAEAKRAHDEMLRLSASIGDKAISAKIEKLIDLSDRIAKDAIEDENDIRQIQKFQSYFLPSTIGLLNAYDRMSAQDLEGKNLTQTKEKISQMLDTEVSAFEKQLDALYVNDAMNIDTDIQVMQKLLEREGLMEPDELHTLLKKAQGQQEP